MLESKNQLTTVKPFTVGINSQRGAVLLETVVALTISLVIIAGVLISYSGAKVSYLTAGNINSIQDTGRFASHTIAEEVRLAGYWGINAKPSAVLELNTANKDYGCVTKGWVTDTAVPIQVLDSPSVSNLPGCIKKENVKLNTDILIIRYAQETLAGLSDIEKGSIYFHSGVFQGRLFEAEENGEIPADADFEEFPATVLYAFNTSIFYIQNCRDPGEDGKCDALDDEGSPIPSLVVMRLKDGSMQSELVAQNVDDLQVLIGLDEDGEEGVDRYEKADASTNWKNAANIEISLLVQAPLKDVDYEDDRDGPKDPFNKNERGSYTFGGQTLAFSDNRRRQAFSTTVFFRNNPDVNIY